MASHKHLARLLLLLVLAAVWPSTSDTSPVSFGGQLFGAAHAQQRAADSRPFEERMAEWEETLDSAVSRLEDPEVSLNVEKELRASIVDLRAQVGAAIQTARERLAPLRRQLDALGPEPSAEEPAEPPAIADEREQVKERIAEFQARIKQGEIMLARADAIEVEMAYHWRSQTFERLSKRYPVPLAPSTLTKAIPEGLGVLSSSSQKFAPFSWWLSLSESERHWFLVNRALLLVVALIAGALLRRRLLRWLPRDPAITDPSYGRRLLAAIAKGVADGLIPALILGVVIWGVQNSDAVAEHPHARMIASVAWALLLFVLAWALPRAVFSPDLPAWRLLPVAAENATKIARRIILLAAVFALDLFIDWTTADLKGSPELDSLNVFTFTILEAGVMLTLLPGSLWRYAPEPSDETEAEQLKRRRQIWVLLRRVAALLTVAAVIASVVGYADLSRFLINNVLFTAAVFGGLFPLRSLGRELVAAILRAQLVRVTLNLKHDTRSLLKFWFRLALDFLLLSIGFSVILLIWGVPFEDLWRSLITLIRGVEIGGVTISLSDIATAIIVFLVIMALTRMFQRTLSEKVLPRTRFDIGVRNSLTQATGYVGLAIAAMAAVGALGLDFSNVAIIAGALSVGIGFGLQAIVNNFVSGLILLIERPVKVGDWVIVGGNEGHVKRISVRATEIETFDRQSVIIPNSELVSSSVGNWTHKDRICRSIIPVGVAYGSDTEKVREILLRVAGEHSNVLKSPEPFVLFRDFGNSSLDFELRCFLSDVNYFLRTPSDLRFAIDKAFREEGVEIPFPQRDLHLRSVSDLTEIITKVEAEAEVARLNPQKKRAAAIDKDMPEGTSDSGDGDGEA